MKGNIIMIPTKNLGIDKCNVRAGEWTSDEELINSIKSLGVLSPLIVRPTGNQKVTHTIVSGSRRFNAGIEAGLKDFPCIPRDLTDAEAIGISITENKDRRDIPTYKYLEKIKWHFIQIDGKLAKDEKIKILKTEMKLAHTTAFAYIDILTKLPEIAFELMKPDEERDRKVRGILKAVSTNYDTTEQLSFMNAWLIARELEDESNERIIDVASTVVAFKITTKNLQELIKQVRAFPKISASKLYKEKVTKMPKGSKYTFYFGSHIVRGMSEACQRENKDWKTLVTEIVESWLKKRGYI